MREYNKLLEELDKKTKELASLSIHVVTSTGVDAVRDKVGERVEYDDYSDPARASKLKTEIELLKEEIVSFPIQGTKLSGEQAERVRKSVVGGIATSAKEEYDKQMEAYMNMNFWGKAKTMFAGKKPKKGASSTEIMDKYGEEAKAKGMQGELARVKREYDALVEWLKDYYKKHPEDQEASLEDRLNEEKANYEARIKEIEERNNSYLEEAKEVVKEGKLKL